MQNVSTSEALPAELRGFSLRRDGGEKLFEADASVASGALSRHVWLMAACFLYLIHTFILAISPDTGVSEVFFSFTGEGRILAANLFMMVSASAGMLGFGFLSDRFPAGEMRRAMLFAFALNGAARLLMAVLPGTGFYTAALFVFMTTWGLAAGSVHYRAARQVATDRLGAFVGRAMAVQALLLAATMLLDKETGTRLASSLMTALTFGAFFWLAMYGTGDAPADTVLRPVEPRPELSGRLPALVLGVALLSVLHGLSDDISYHTMTLYAPLFWLTRLTYAAGLLAAGRLADQHRLYLPLAALFARSSVLFYRLYCTDESLFPYLALADDFFCGFSIVFVMLVFLDLATSTERPALWAGMGRVIEMPLASVGAALGGILFSTPSLYFALYLGLLFTVFALIYRAMLVYLRKEGAAVPAFAAAVEAETAEAVTAETRMTSAWDEPAEEIADETENETNAKAAAEAAETFMTAAVWEEDEPEADPSAEDETLWASAELFPASGNDPELAVRVAKIGARFGLTSREEEVLRRLAVDEAINDIADVFRVKVRTIRFHISNMMVKTQTKTQRELIQLVTLREAPEEDA